MTTLLILAALLSLLFALPPSWQPQHSGSDASLRGICPVSDTVAWASGTNGTVLRTTDGGAHWETLRVPDEARALDFRDIEAWDANRAVVLSSGPGEASRVYKTIDGGNHWRLCFINPEPKGFYDGFAFWDTKHGIALSDPVDGAFRLLMTDDGGETWKPLTPAHLPPALPDEGAFAASGTCLAVRGSDEVWFGTGGKSGARVFHSSDRGAHWSAVSVPLVHGAASQGVFSIAAAPVVGEKNVCLTVGGDYAQPKETSGTSASSRDGGVTWTRAEHGPAGYRSAVALIPHSSPQTWVAVGTAGSDYSRDGGVTWRPLDTQNYNALRFAPSGRGWAVGPHGYIARFVGIPESIH